MATTNHHPSRLILSLSCATSLAFALAGTAPADVIVRYDLDPAGASATDVAAVETHADVSATPYKAHAGAFSSNNDNHYLFGGNANNNTIADAVRNNVAGGFTVTVSDGKVLNLDSLAFVFGSDNAEVGDIFSIHLRSSRDGFDTDIDSVTRTGITGTNTSGVTFDLGIPELQGVTGSIEFKLFLVSNATDSNEYIRVMPDLVLHGTVDVPEPGSAALAGLATLSLLMRRRAAA